MYKINVSLGFSVDTDGPKRFFSLKHSVIVPLIIPGSYIKVINTSVKVNVNELFYDPEAGVFNLYESRQHPSLIEDIKRFQEQGWQVYENDKPIVLK